LLLKYRIWYRETSLHTVHS